MYNKSLILEINRIKEMMGLINEGAGISGWIDDIFKIATENKVILSSLKLTERITPSNIDLTIKSIDDGVSKGIEESIFLKETIESLSKKEKLTYKEIIKKILSEDKAFENKLIDEMAEIKVRKIVKNAKIPNSFEEILEKNLNPVLKQIIDNQTSATVNIFEKIYLESGPEALESELKRRYKKINELDQNLYSTKYWKNIYESLAEKYGITLDETIESTSPVVSDLRKNAITKLKNGRGQFKSKFKNVFDNVLKKDWGMSSDWKVILGEDGVKNEMKGLDILQQIDPNKKYKLQFRLRDANGNLITEITIPEFRKILEGDSYKLFGKEGGDYSKVNFLDTNYSQNTELFLNEAEKFLSKEDYDKLLSYLVDENVKNNAKYQEMTKLMDDVMSHIENNKAIWENLMTDSKSTELIGISRGSGNSGEALFKEMLDEAGLPLLWAGMDGSPTDRMLSIDAIFRDEKNTVSTAQVKKFGGKIYEQKNLDNILGDSYKIWSSRRLQFSENIDYAVLVDSQGNIMMYGKTLEVDNAAVDRVKASGQGELFTRTGKESLKPISKGKMTFIDDSVTKVKFLIKNL